MLGNWVHPIEHLSPKNPLIGAKARNFKLPLLRTTVSRPQIKHDVKSESSLPENFAWSPESLTNVRNQGQCGSCWAFAITDMLANRIKIKTKVDIPLSVQHLLNCCAIDSHSQCGGNDIETAFSTLPKTGIVSEESLPYKKFNYENEESTEESEVSIRDETCPEIGNNEYTVFASNTKQLISNNLSEEENINNMKSHIYTEGPIVGVMLEVYPDFVHYDGISIYDPLPGQVSEGGHAIEIIGWGKKENTNYWVCRNSWGPDWPAAHLQGMGKGWFYIKMGVCGMDKHAYSSTPETQNSNPPSVVIGPIKKISEINFFSDNMMLNIFFIFVLIFIVLKLINFKEKL